MPFLVLNRFEWGPLQSAYIPSQQFFGVSQCFLQQQQQLEDDLISTLETTISCLKGLSVLFSKTLNKQSFDVLDFKYKKTYNSTYTLCAIHKSSSIPLITWSTNELVASRECVSPFSAVILCSNFSLFFFSYIFSSYVTA